jgi:hypothetical protein
MMVMTARQDFNHIVQQKHNKDASKEGRRRVYGGTSIAMTSFQKTGLRFGHDLSKAHINHDSGGESKATGQCPSIGQSNERWDKDYGRSDHCGETSGHCNAERNGDGMIVGRCSSAHGGLGIHLSGSRLVNEIKSI